MEIGYLGGILRRSPAAPRRAAGCAPGAVKEDWGWMGQDCELFLHADGSLCLHMTWDSLAIVLRGYARPRGADALDLERVIEEVRCHYLEHGELAVEDLEGSFTLALLDGQAQRVLLYRNLVGSGFTYYYAGSEGMLFGSNLAELLDTTGTAPRLNQAMLPTFFLYRWVPGRETLLDGFYRLLPGELVSWDAGGLTRTQKHTFADLRGDMIPTAESLPRLEATMDAVMVDCARLRPQTANLLSGGVDSSYLQAVWNRVIPLDDPLPPSVSISVDHPSTWLDTDYALTASRALGTRHTLIPATDPYAGYLLDTLASTAEPPNHVQSAYFGHLARTMVAQGLPSGLCGEGADSLFGLGLANQVHNARVLRKLAPLSALRGLGAFACGLAGWDRLEATFHLAGNIGDFTYPPHPVNQVAAFTDWQAVESCFGRPAVAEAAARRRGLLDHFAVPSDAQERLHAAGFLGEAMDSASLWTTLFNRAGADLLSPFLDSRTMRLALNLSPEARFRFRKPKDLLKRALTRLAPPVLAQRSKLGFGQPIFEWLAPGGMLRPLVERIGGYEFVEPATLARVLQRPTWFLYSLLCLDLWHKLFIERSLPRPTRLTPAWRQEAPLLAAGCS
jgi:asparagine synthase (glutamine-hydrolysing)